MADQGLRFSKTHEWVSIDGDQATVGISEHAVEELGDIVYLDLPSVGSSVNAGERLGEVESVKAVSDIYAPVGGSVTEVNAELESRAELVNEAPLDAGWLVKLKVKDSSELAALMDRDQYQSFIAEEG